MSLRVGFLGAGFIARFHRGLLADVATDHRLALVFDPDVARAEAFAAEAGADVATSPEEVLDGCDALYVCTWTSAHETLVHAACERRLAIFCEKPLAADLAGARRMTEAVERAGVVNQVGLVLRSLPTFRYLHHLLRQPWCGRPMALVFRDDQYLPVQGQYGSTWRADRDRAGAGVLLEHSIHDLDLIDWLVGPVGAVGARTASFHGLDGIEDVATVAVELRDGGLGTLTTVWHDVLARPSLRRLEILCERAWFALDHELAGPLRIQRQEGAEEVLEGRALDEAARAVGAGWDSPARRFVEAATSGKGTWPDFATALRAHELADAAYESARSGEGRRIVVRGG